MKDVIEVQRIPGPVLESGVREDFQGLDDVPLEHTGYEYTLPRGGSCEVGKVGRGQSGRSLYCTLKRSDVILRATEHTCDTVGRKCRCEQEKEELAWSGISCL